MPENHNNRELRILESGKKITAKEAVYEELPGAKKDAGCAIVEVPGGVSAIRGCCDLFRYRKGAALFFRCGTCVHVTSLKKEADEYGS